MSDVLRQEAVSGALLLVGALLALVWANSPFAASYTAIRDFAVGTDALGLHLRLTLAQWASDGLLALFFFTVGLELKREFVAGDLRNPARAALPIAAAVGGMTVPALIFLACTAHAGAAAMRGWAVPTATDIAFAVAVLAVISTHLPSALRTFLLTLAVVDDLIAITVIAVFYTDHVDLRFLGLAVCPLALFAVCVQRRVRAWWLLLPLGLATWSLVHASGVHATVAGVLLGFAVPVLRSAAAGGPTAGPGLAEHLEHLVRPLSAGVAVPLFAFFAAGVTVGGYRGFVEALSDPVGLGVASGLIVGKVVGVFGTTRFLASVTRASLDESLRWVDVFGMSVLAGIGFTVSLLIGELAYGLHSQPGDHVKVAVFTGSVASAVLAAVILRARNRHYRVVEAQEHRDDDQDGIPDAFQSDTRGRNDSVPRAPDGVNEASMAPPGEPGVR